MHRPARLNQHHPQLDGCITTDIRTGRRNRLRGKHGMIGRIPGRLARDRKTMALTLGRLAAAAESTDPSRPGRSAHVRHGEAPADWAGRTQG
jgi:hypothetical protein